MRNLDFKTEDDFEFIIIMSLLSRKSIRVSFKSNINEKRAFLQLLKCISPDMEHKIIDDVLCFTPGPLVGGQKIEEAGDICSVLKPLMLISPFLKDPICLELSGITNSHESVDIFKITFYTIYKIFGIPGFNINIKRRGFAPDGEGLVTFKIDNIRHFNNIDLRGKEELCKIRGMVITSRISSDFSHRMIDEIKNEMASLANTKVLCIVNNRSDSGPSPGYECSVTAESGHGLFFYTCNTKEIPEKMARKCCFKTLKSIKKGGTFDSKLLPYIIVYMGLARGVGNLRIGQLDPQSKRILALLNEFFEIEYKVAKDGNENILTVMGCGYSNPFKPL